MSDILLFLYVSSDAYYEELELDKAHVTKSSLQELVVFVEWLTFRCTTIVVLHYCMENRVLQLGTTAHYRSPQGLGTNIKEG